MLLLWLPMVWAVMLIPVAVIAALLLALLGKRSATAWKIWVGGPLGCALVPALLIALLLLGSSAWYAWRPASSALAEVLPGEHGDRALRARTSAGLDSSSIIVELRYDPAWLTEIGSAYAFRPIDPDSALVASIGMSDKGWWRILYEGADCPVERQVQRQDLEGWDDVVLVDCPRARRMFLIASNID
jgi:hypothetical protein